MILGQYRAVLAIPGLLRALLVILCQYGGLLVGTWWYWVSMGRYWLVLGGTGSVLGGSGWYLVVLGQYGAVLVGTWWYWVSITRHCLVFSCIANTIGSGKCLYACIYWKK